VKTTKFSREGLVSLLRGGTCQSGEALAAQLGVTRAAVWKAIRQLGDKGYRIESCAAKGYRLVATPDLDPDALRQGIIGTGSKIGHDIRFLESVASTNIVAADLAAQGAGDGATIIADAQTAGKGRLGRSWVSPTGRNIYMSIILRPNLMPRDAPILTLMTAVAFASAIRLATSVPCAIKWPNDLMVGSRKLGGILTELTADMDHIAYAVVGIGINVNLAREDLPDEIQTLATSLMIETGGSVQSRTELIRCMLVEMDRWYRLVQERGKMPVLDAWRELSCTLGQSVKVSMGAETFTGSAEDIDEEGLLVVRLDSGLIRKVSAGDVTLLRAHS
jgi:BirA family biotin operon repressor/biotin-[acetyl-CoA-carboxylase] ligase